MDKVRQFQLDAMPTTELKKGLKAYFTALARVQASKTRHATQDRTMDVLLKSQDFIAQIVVYFTRQYIAQLNADIENIDFKDK